MALSSIVRFPFRILFLTLSIVWFSIKLSYYVTSLLPLVSYLFWVYSTTALMLLAHEHEFVDALAGIYDHRYLRMGLSFFMAFVSEAPHYVALYKLLFFYTARFWGVFNYWLGWFAMLVDIISFSGCVLFYVENVLSVQDLLSQSKGCLPEAPHFTVWSLVKKSLTPLYEPFNVLCYKCVVYFGAEELRENSVKRLQMHNEGLVDIFTMSYPAGSKRPVVLYIHGGSWSMGSKDVPCSMTRILAERGFVVVSMNYRLAPKYPMPAGFLDVKLALIWVKQNIIAFGGDPDFVFTAGDSAGAHLAQLASMTANMAKFQLGDRRDIDTSIRGSILIAPVLDLLDKYKLPRGHQRPEWFRKTICGDADMSVAESLAPANYLSEKKLAPTLCFHGLADNLVDYRQSTSFQKEANSLGLASQFTLILMPRTHHAHMIFNSPRVIAEGHIAADWAMNIWLKEKP